MRVGLSGRSQWWSGARMGKRRPGIDGWKGEGEICMVWQGRTYCRNLGVRWWNPRSGLWLRWGNAVGSQWEPSRKRCQSWSRLTSPYLGLAIFSCLLGFSTILISMRSLLGSYRHSLMTALTPSGHKLLVAGSIRPTQLEPEDCWLSFWLHTHLSMPFPKAVAQRGHTYLWNTPMPIPPVRIWLGNSLIFFWLFVQMLSY